MLRMKSILAAATCTLFATLAASASDAETSASARGGRGQPGSASASARYVGEVGFARTDTRTGVLNLSRAVAVGVDRDGLSLSLSTAIAPQRGPALATNFNLSIGANGQVSHSNGQALAQGGRDRYVSAGGRSGTHLGGSAISTARGLTRHGGIVRVSTQSRQDGPRSGMRRLLRVR